MSDEEIAARFERRAAELQGSADFGARVGLPHDRIAADAVALRRAAHVLRTALQMEKALEVTTAYHGYPDAPCGCTLCRPAHVALAAYREGK